MAGVVVALDGGIFDGSVHALDLTIGPGMVRLGQAMFDSILCADAVEQMAGKPCSWPIAIAWRVTKLNTVVGQDGV